MTLYGLFQAKVVEKFNKQINFTFENNKAHEVMSRSEK